jgi:hypothetical protein
MAAFLCSVRPKKDKPNRTQFTVGGDRINYPGKVATPTADMLVVKILFNRVKLTRGARFMAIDISNFYLMTPLKQPEYIHVKINNLPEEIINEYKLRAMVNKSGMVCIEVTKDMYANHKQDFSRTSSSNKAQQKQLLPKQTGTRPMGAHHKTHFFHTRCQQFWRKIRW